MRHTGLAAAGVLIALNLSCASYSTPAAAPAPQPGAGAAAAPAARSAPPPPAAAPAVPPGAAPGGAGGRAGAPPGGGFPGGGRGPQLTPEQNTAHRDSLTAMRADVIKGMMARIAGSEDKRAADVFTNVQLMKDTTAAQLLKTMDYYGRSLSVGCQFCHVADGKWDDDSKPAKKTARVMIELVNLINTQGLSKLPPRGNGQTPKISCVTCHRGRQGPGQALLP